MTDEQAHERIDMLRDALMETRTRLAALETEVRELREMTTRSEVDPVQQRVIDAAGSRSGGDTP